MAQFQHSVNASTQTKLLISLKNRNLDDFASIINGESIDVNYFYGYPDNGTLLDIACRSSKNSQFVRILLDHHDINLNAINNITGLAAIHEAVKNSDEDTLKVLIESTTPNGSICSINTADKYGNTALHIAVKRNNVKFMNMLLQKCCLGIDINEYTRQNATPLHLALHLGNMEAAKVLLDLAEIDLDYQRDSEGRTCRQIIQQRYPELAEKLPEFKSTCKIEPILFSLLSRRDSESFIEVASQVNVEYLKDNYDHQTYLHYACEYGLSDVVDMLLEKKVDPNKKSIAGHTPIMLAAKNNHYDIFMKLLNRPDIRLQIEGVESVLHTVILDMFSQNHDSRRDHRKYLELLLSEAVPRGKLDINLPDQDGWTALHYAVLLNDQHVIKLLLRAGAHLYQENPKGEVPLTSIKAASLADLLDSSITYKNESAFVSDYEIIYDYRILVQPSADHVRDGNEMTFFNILERAPELRKMFKHPLLKSFLQMKWYLVKKYYFIHLAFIFVYCLTLTGHVLYFNYNRRFSANITTDNIDPIRLKFWMTGGLPLLTLYLILCLIELYQFRLRPILYIKSPENALKITMILATGAVIIFDPHLDPKWRPFAAAAILGSWMQTMLLLGKHPKLSTHIEMLKRVTWNFLKFLTPYSIMILAFAFSFLILSPDVKKDDGSSQSNKNETCGDTGIFQGFMIKIFQLIPMLSGNINTDFVPVNCEVTPSNIFFILFIFLICIVTFNLLNGLAVSDTKAIKEDAELIGIMSQIKFISYLEHALTIPNRNPFRCLRPYLPGCCFHCTKWWFVRKISSIYSYIEPPHHKISLFPERSEETRVRVFPYRNNVVIFPKNDDGGGERNSRGRIFKLNKCTMDPDIVKQTIDILEKRDKSCSVDNLSRCLQLIQRQESRFQNIENAIQRISEQINELRSEIHGKQKIGDD